MYWPIQRNTRLLNWKNRRLKDGLGLHHPHQTLHRNNLTRSVTVPVFLSEDEYEAVSMMEKSPILFKTLYFYKSESTEAMNTHTA